MTVAWAVAERRTGRDGVVRTATEALGIPVVRDVAHLCPRCGSSEHGRPFAAGRAALGLSIAWSAELVAAAAGDGLAVGIDVERFDERRFEGLGPVVLHRDETAASAYDLARTWTRKEAVLKALGTGLSVDPRTVRLEPTANGATVRDLPPAYDPTRLVVRDLALPDGYVGALAVVLDHPGQEVSVLAASAAPARGARPGRGR